MTLKGWPSIQSIVETHVFSTWPAAWALPLPQPGYGYAQAFAAEAGNDIAACSADV